MSKTAHSQLKLQIGSIRSLRSTEYNGKSDMLIVSSIPGVAVACHPKDILPGQAIGEALESFNNDSEGLIEILVGRL